MNDSHHIGSLEQLRNLIQAQKVTAALDDDAKRFIAASPLAVARALGQPADLKRPGSAGHTHHRAGQLP